MRTSTLSIIYHAGTRVRDESEASWALRLWILHDHHIHDLAPLLEVAFQCFISRSVVQAADKKLSCTFRFSDVLEWKCKKLATLKFLPCAPLDGSKRNDRVIGSLASISYLNRANMANRTNTNIELFSLFFNQFFATWNLLQSAEIITRLSTYIIIVALLVLLLVGWVSAVLVMVLVLRQLFITVILIVAHFRWFFSLLLLLVNSLID